MASGFIERPGLEIPETVRIEFACAVYDAMRQATPSEAAINVLTKQYMTEGFFMEGVEAVFIFNEWAYSPTHRKMFRNIFRKSRNIPTK